MKLFTEVLIGVADVMVFAIVGVIILFIIGYVPVFWRSPSSLGRTILGGKLALLLLAGSSLLGTAFRGNFIVLILQFLSIVAILLWLGYDYAILRHIQNRGLKLPWWKRLLPFDNNRRK